MLTSGYIALHRKIVEWEWYKNSNTKIVFLHLLLTANYEDKKFEGKVIKRGSRIASSASLASELGLSRQEIKTAIKHLKSTNEITTQATSKYTVFTVVNYDMYQALQPTEQPTSNQQVTSNQPASNHNGIKINKAIKNNKAIKREGKPPHHKYGEFKHVLLTDEQYAGLVKSFGEPKVKDYIRRVDEYCEQHNKSYKNYSLTIRKWINNDSESRISEKSGNQKQTSYDLGEWEQYAMNFDPTKV